MVSNKTVITKNSKNYDFVTLSYPADLTFMSLGHTFVIGILHPDVPETTRVAVSFDSKNHHARFEKESSLKFKRFDYYIDYKDETIYFQIYFDWNRAIIGTYLVSLKRTDYLIPCEFISITVKSLFWTRF